MKNDLRFALRQLLKNPGFATVAVITLSLGIGASTAIFSLINAVLLRDLPFPRSDQLAVVWASNPGLKTGMPQIPPANADIATLRDHNKSFARLAAFSPRTADLAEGGDAERVGAAGVTAGFFETLGITPILGRTLAAGEDIPGGPQAVLISHGLWTRRFGADPAVVGRSISVNGDRRTVIGILPPTFDFPRGAEWPAFFPFGGRTEVWLPLALRLHNDGSGWSNWESRDERGLVLIGRLNPGMTLKHAQAEMNAFSEREAKDHPDSHEGWRLGVVSLRHQLAGKSQATLLTLMGAVGLLLLIACANVANLLLVRGVARQQEMAVRSALGAGRSRLMRQLSHECLLLSVLGSAGGLVVATTCLHGFLILNPLGHSRLDEARLDPVVLGFMGLLTVATSFVFGLVPALQISRTNLQDTLREAGRGESSSRRERMRGFLVGVEVALALILLTMAGLLVRSFLRVQAVHPGFRSDSVLAFDLQLPGARYPEGPAAISFFRELTLRLEALPGVRAVGAISYLPLGGGENMGSFVVEGDPPVNPGGEPKAERRWVTPGYFAAMGIPIRRGRVFTAADDPSQPSIAVINETLAREFLGTRDPVGHRLRLAGGWRTVVGIVADVKSASLESDVRPQIYLPHAQDPWPPMSVVLHTDGNPLALASAVRGELRRLDPLLPAAGMRTLDQVVSNARNLRRFSMALLTFFAATALLLTMLGIYGMVAFLAGLRVREIGIRMALGARRSDVHRLILSQGMKPVAIGSLAGLVGSVIVARLVATQLYGVSPSDLPTRMFIVVLLISVALLASWFPARRAAKANPMVALRRG